MQDKWYVFPYCGFKVDVPDAFEIAHVEETVLPDGTCRRVKTSRRRKDLPGNGENEGFKSGEQSEIPVAIASKLVGGDGEHFAISTGDASDLRTIVEKAANGTLGEGLHGLLPDGAFEAGKHYTVTSQVTESRVFTSGGTEARPVPTQQASRPLDSVVSDLLSASNKKVALAVKLLIAVAASIATDANSPRFIGHLPSRLRPSHS